MSRTANPLRKLPAHIAGMVTISDSGCWEFGGYRNAGGYGVAPYRGKHNLTHRVSYERHIGPIPDGLVIDHLCRNKPCCNPRHLEAVEHNENIRRGDSYLAVSETDHGDLVTVSQAARRMGVARHSVQAALVAGHLSVAKWTGPSRRPVRLLSVAAVDSFFGRPASAPTEGVAS